MRKNGWLSLILCALGVGLTLGQARLTPAQAAGANRVGLMITYGDGAVEHRCVSFANDQITGLEVLQAAGLSLEVDYSSIGAAVCKIGDVGCPADDCFCDSPPNFWSYWHLKDGRWVFSQLGASNYTVSPGTVEAWVWGSGQSNPPQAISFEQICAEETVPTEAPTSTATTAPTLAPTETPTWTVTSEPTLGATVTQMPTTSPKSTTATLPTPQAANEPEQPAGSSDIAPPSSALVYFPLLVSRQIAAETAPGPAGAIPAGNTPTHLPRSTETHRPTLAPTPTRPAQTVTPQTGDVRPPRMPGAVIEWGSYLCLGLIIAGLGIGLLLASHKKWK